MAKLLIVDARRDACSAVEAALQARRHEVTVATSGSFVLTMLERNRPDLIVSHAVLEDMTGCELCAIVRADPATHAIRFVLVTDSRKDAPALPPLTHVDSTLPDNASPAGLVRRVEELLLERALAMDPGRHSPGRHGSGDVGAEIPACGPVNGALDVLDLCDVVQAVSEARQRGWLLVRFHGTSGAIAFEAGEPVHAAFQGRTGNQAFMDLALATVGRQDATFQFVPSRDPCEPALPSSLTGDVETLTCRVAAQLDAARRNTDSRPAGSTRKIQPR